MFGTALFLILTTASPALADNAAAIQSSCASRVADGLIQNAVIGTISSEAQNEVLCGNEKSDRETFELGSISKSFAGIALAKLSLAGKIDLEAPISKYLPELQGTYMGAVTTHQLATHSAQFTHLFEPWFWNPGLSSKPSCWHFLSGSNSERNTHPTCNGRLRRWVRHHDQI